MSDPTKEDLVNVDRAFQVAWIVYINGIEVPAVACSVSYGVWDIPQAEIHLVPDPILQRLGADDRVSVQVFYCDYWMTPETPQFRLMFDGEIVGWSYVNVHSDKSISFDCLDYIQIWQQLFFFFMSSVNDMATGASGDQIGVTANGVVNTGFAPIYPYSLFAQGIVPTTASDAEGAEDQGNGGTPLITRPIDFVYNVVRALIDIRLPNRTTPASNFFSPWTRKTNFHKRFVALPYLEESTNPGVFPILRAVQANYAVDAVAQMANRVGTAGSIWQMLKEILQTLTMEIAMLPTPPAVGGNYQTLNITGVSPRTSTPGTPVFLANYFTKPQFFFGVPPVSNVFFPSQIRHYAYQEDYATQPTRMYFNEETMANYLQVDANASPTISALLRDSLAVAHPEEVNIAARAAITDRSINGKDLLVYPDEFYRGPVVDRRPIPTWFTFLGQAGAQTPTPGTTPAPTPVEPEYSTAPAAPPDAPPEVLYTPSDGQPADPPVTTPSRLQEDTADSDLARRAGVPVEILRAIRAVESGRNRQTRARRVRFEPRLFHRDTHGRYTRAQVPYTPRDQLPEGVHSLTRETNRAAFERAAQYDREMAIRCTSWGTYQVLGGGLIRLYPDDPVGSFDANPERVSDELLVQWFRDVPARQIAAEQRNIAQLAWRYNNSGPLSENPHNLTWYNNVNAELVRIRTGRVPTVSSTPTAPVADADTETTTSPDISPGDSVRDVFRLYAKYEFFKEKYSRRSGSLQLVFNPYPVPGFPCATFDRRSTQVDTVGYLMTVRQVMRSNGWDTQVAFTQGRTFQEMFSLMQKQFAFENETLRTQSSEITNAAADSGTEVDPREASATTVNPVGVVAAAPPEPLAEIRDVIQSFERAEGFYRALFFREAAQSQTRLTIQQASSGADRPATTPSTTAATSTTAEPTQSLDPAAVSDPAPEQAMSVPPAQTETLYTPQLQATSDVPPTKKAALYYPDIIRFRDLNTGEQEDVFIRGVDSLGREQALAALERFKANDFSQAESDAELIRRVSLVQDVPTTAGPNNAAAYADIESQIRTRPTVSNVRGDVELTPKPEAIQLFESYESAMRYCARPICTLDEYISFLGENGIRESPIYRDGALAANDPRVFPATYYAQIRQYVDGPPATLPTTNITNTDFISGQDGAAGTVSPAAGQPVSGLPANFPETRAAWSTVLRLYRQRTLNNLPPRT